MDVVVDIGNTRVKCGIALHNAVAEEVSILDIPPLGKRLGEESLRRLFHWEILSGSEVLADYPKPLTWWIAQTGSFSWQKLKAEIQSIRANDRFNILTHQQIPLERDVELPAKVGMDRLLAAFAAVEAYGDVPLLIVDAGSAVTMDVVQNQTFHGGAIFPGLTALSAIYPQISPKLPHVPIPHSSSNTRPVYPGRNTQEALQNGLYWGTIGAIRQFYGMLRKENATLILTGGDAQYLFPGLTQEIPASQIQCHPNLVLEGIRNYLTKHVRLTQKTKTPAKQVRQ